ncbi:MAG: DUF1553 domain-containing protein [Planctomycetia bacterium]|nr:DUF1553 domain-containing protein [Planctomycetia bacterium]
MATAVIVAALLPTPAAFAAPPSDSVEMAERDFWSFRKLSWPVVPAVRQADRVRTTVDAFVLAHLEERTLGLSPEAPRNVLIRRLWLDLVGLPPPPEAVAEFLADESPDACERLVDRLLASPHFGERWGRHWLDVVGYVDTVGFDVDADNIITSDSKWLYRDWVIRALNADLPYDRFLQEQIAGDELVDWRRAPQFTNEIRDLLAATGYLRTAQDFTHEDVGNIPQNHFNILHDTLEIVGSSVLGLTLNCARCHNHKFDPVPQEDYYRLMAAFTPAYNPQDWRVVLSYDKKLPDRSLADVSPADRAEIDRHNAEIERQVQELTKRIDEIRRPHREKLLESKLGAIPEPIRADTKAAVETPAEKRSEIQKYLAGKFSGQLKISDDELAAALGEADRQSVAKLADETKEKNSRRRSYGKIQALWDVGTVPPTHRLTRGNFETPGPEVSPGFLRVLCDGDSAATATPVAPYEGTSGRRLALAKWLTARDSRAGALAARVMVNRAWQHLFGTGLVSTPENFGFGGAVPSHPELLEWLSAEFVEQGWSVKHLIRVMACSSVYRQSAVPSTAEVRQPAVDVDPDNRLLWRMRLKRLESEIIRDSVLATSGCFDATAFGPPVMLEWRPDGMVVVAEKQLRTPTAKWRRSVYLLARRAFQLSELTVFDQPVVATNCPERTSSAVPLQSLTMLNGEWLWEQAEQFASRLERPAQASPADRVARAFQLALGRLPGADELRESCAFLDRQQAAYRQQEQSAEKADHRALVHLCHTLLNTSEFLYVP